MKIAFVYDRVNKFGGAERILLALHAIWPDAPLYTAINNPSKASWTKNFSVHSSFMQKIPFAVDNHELFAFFTPFVFESFCFDDYDIVVSITSADTKSIVTKPDTLHICYCLTPTRYAWSGYQDYLKEPGLGVLNSVARLSMRLFSVEERHNDYISSFRPDAYIAISKTVHDRIRTYYKKESKIVYPPLDTKRFKPGIKSESKEKYFLIVSRLVPYKKIDYAIVAFNKLSYKLKIIGMGIDRDRLKKIAGKNIEFIDGNLTDQELCWYYQNCSALIFPGAEDFGLTVVEAQSCGRPVIAYNQGGASETIVNSRTGELYDEESSTSLISAIQKFMLKKYSVLDCVNNTRYFSADRFQTEFYSAVLNEWERFKERI